MKKEFITYCYYSYSHSKPKILEGNFYRVREAGSLYQIFDTESGEYITTFMSEFHTYFLFEEQSRDKLREFNLNKLV